MTSSLVGSGDVYKRQPQDEPIIINSVNADDIKRNAVKCKNKYWIEPVSYTHLTLPTICSV
eukprot:3238899-Prorocentrum_lima.AAC.1